MLLCPKTIGGTMSVKDSLFGDVATVKDHIESESNGVSSKLMEDQNVTCLFEDVNGGRAAGNIFSTREKIAKAMNISKEGIVDHLLNAITNPKPYEIVDDPEFRQCSLPVDLMKLPIPKYFPEDGGRYITSGVIVVDYDGKKNVSFHRMMIMDAKHIAVRLVPRHLFTIFNMAKDKG